MWRTGISPCPRPFLALAAWIAAVGIGLVLLLAFDTRPGSTGVVDGDWPPGSQIHRDADHAQLLMFAHPHCPCTRASLDELAHVMTHCQGLVSAHVLFLKPRDAHPDWEKTDLWQAACEVPGDPRLLDAFFARRDEVVSVQIEFADVD